MSRLPASFKISFRTKVLVPVVVVMVLLLAVSMWLMNWRFKEQIQTGAAAELKTAGEALQWMQQDRAAALLANFRNAKSEPRFKAAAGMFKDQPGLNSSQRTTFIGVLNDLIADGVADVIVLTPEQGEPMAAMRDARLNLPEFQASASNLVQQAFENRAGVDTVENNERLLDIVTIPISVVGDTNNIVGVISFGIESPLAHEFQRLTQSELALLSDGRVVSSTFLKKERTSALPEKFQRLMTRDENENGSEELVGADHFLCLAGWLGAANDSHRLGYLVLSSYEKPLQKLQATRQMILLASSLAILCGGLVVWLLISKITRPLRELRDSAEAVGRGDFTRRVAVRSNDECGELAAVFNQMTENLQQSRTQLEKTVETLKGTQAQLIQSEKLSAVGEFVAGVAHELNNPLTAVMGFSELLKDADVDIKHRRHLDIIFKSAQRCQKIVQSLLSFARRQKPERKPVSVNQLIAEVLEIVSYPLRTSNITVVTRLEPDLPVVLADAHQIQQVCMNIINNARQAIEAHQTEGEIKIATETGGAGIRIIIQDNGPGIPEKNLRSIFDPFFTTKEVGKGTGLGLSLCYGLIKEHGGNITPLSRPGEGATFIIELPVVSGLAMAAQTASSPAGRRDTHEGAGKKILLIDDEETLLEMMRDELDCHGYAVDAALDGEAGLRLIRESRYAAIFCDLKMPGMNGRQVYEQLRAMNPGQARRFVFITGDVVNEQLRTFLESEKLLCLNKPFALADLREAIQAVQAAT